jgi:hypothetical protein
MFESIANRRKSYTDILNQMNKQESQVIICFNYKPALKNWYEIKNVTGLNHDSVKRCISNLSTDSISINGKLVRNYKKVLMENGSSKNPETGKSITNYRLMTAEELNNFHNNLQETLF